MEGGSGGRRRGKEEEREGGKKNACIQTGGLTELMGTGRGAFLRGNHLHNGKVVGVGAESSPLVGTVSGVEGESSYLMRTSTSALRGGRCMPAMRSFASCHLLVSSAKQFTNSLSDVRSQYVPTNLLLKRLAAELLRLHSTNDSHTIVSSQLAMINRRLIDLKIEILPNYYYYLNGTSAET